ncbi:Protein kinase [metagenome]|uniref:Protein kinase n=1 Tax=metagenome TaxID=256318 RepID=A0A2P2BY30_9ZZZZ
MTYVDPAQRYRLDSRIATGGMGVVWRGTDTVLDRVVAIKVLKPEYADDPQFRSRFETEARHAAALHHPGVAAVFDFGEGVLEDSPRPYLVMELVDGQPLSNLLRPQQPMEPEVVRELMALTADALAAAHAAGIVHRDIKPANLMVLPDRRVKITDFGIARAADGLALTATGQVMGTPQYLSPEQAEGGTATFASDIYSLGVVAFECLAGYRPFVGETPVTTALAHLREPVPELPAQVPADLARVVRRAMAKQPEDRFGSATEFAAALRNPRSVPDRVIPVAPAPMPSPGPATAVLPAVTGQVAQTGPTHSAASVSNPWPWVLLAVVAIVALVALVVSQSGGDETPTGPSETTSAPSSPTEEASTPSSPTAPAVVSIDAGDYVGRNVDDVAQELRELGLRVSTVRVDNPGEETPDDVSDVSPTGDLEEGDRVTVSYWGAAPVEPSTPPTTPTDPTSPTASDTTPAAKASSSTTPSGAGAQSGQKNGKVNHR